MDDYTNAELGMRVLPGVDLTLWLHIVLSVLMVAVVAGIGIAAA